MKTQLFLFAQMAMAAAMMYSCFCRLTKTNADTHREVRWAFIFEGMCAGLVMGAPVLPALVPEARWEPGTTPTAIWLLLLLSVWLVQLVTAQHWKHGVPAHFQRERSRRDNPLEGWLSAPFALALALFLAMPQDTVAQGRTPVEVPIFAMKAGDTVRCVQADGCIIFTKKALAEEFARYADQACGPSTTPNAPLPRLPKPSA
jgi:hypothetical protein